MSRILRLTLLFGLGLMSMLVSRSAHTTPLALTTERISLRTNGNEANDDSDQPDISADGRFIAFSSDATELVSGDDNNARDIFVHDRETGSTERVSLNSDGEEANFDSDAPAISDDGRFVTFHSFATNLRDNDTNGVADIFLHDRQSGDTTVVNIVLGGQADDISYDPDISGNGQFITFWSHASNLVGGDTNEVADVFRYDRIAQTMFRASLDSNGVQGNGHSRYPTISQNGRYLAFESDASNLTSGDTGIYRDVFWHDMNTGETKRVSLRHNDQEANGDSFEAAIAADGRYVAFTSLANDITDNDDNVRRDIFVRDTQNDTTELITAVMGDIDTWELPSISGNGRYVTYRGRPAPEPPQQACQGVLCEIFVYDRQTDTVTQASVSSGGTVADGDSYQSVLAADGRYLAFSSKATNLVANDDNGRRDIFLRDFLPAPTLTINHATGQPGSIFALNGTYYPPNQSVAVWINGVLLGQSTSDSSGNLHFRLQSQPTSDSGAYFVTTQIDTFSGHASFYLDSSHPLHPDAGSGPLFALPNGIAFTHFQFLPLVAQ